MIVNIFLKEMERMNTFEMQDDLWQISLLQKLKVNMRLSNYNLR